MHKKIYKLVLMAILSAITVILTIISNYIVIGSISINLSLIPIGIAAILYGPLYGLAMGLINGIVVMCAPSTQAFFNMNIFGTILVCLGKTGLAGLLSGVIYRLFKKKEKLGIVVSSLIIPIINTSIFIIGSLIFFQAAFGEVISIFVTLNFIIEFLVLVVLTPTIIYIIKIFKNRDVDDFEKEE